MLILGLGVAADQILVQPHEQGQGVVDRAEGYGSDWGEMGVRFKMFLLELQSQKEMTPLSQLVPVMYLTQVTFWPPNLGATMGLNTWLLAKVTRLRLPSVHPAAI